MADELNEVSSSVRGDSVIWTDILKLQLDGVMMHTVLFEKCSACGLTGCMSMHKHHAEEEFSHYLHVLGDYINTYEEVPEMAQISSPAVKLDGTAVEEKVIKCIELYENWEKGVCVKLKAYQNELTDGKEYVNELIEEVHCELKCINLMTNDLLDGKYEELEEWLSKKYGE